MMKFAVIAFLTLIFAVPAFSNTHKDSYPQPCSELWTAVKDTISNPDNYTVQGTPDDAKMTASYNVKHAVHAQYFGSGGAAHQSGHLDFEGHRLRDASGVELQRPCARRRGRLQEAGG